MRQVSDVQLLLLRLVTVVVAASSRRNYSPPSWSDGKTIMPATSQGKRKILVSSRRERKIKNKIVIKEAPEGVHRSECGVSFRLSGARRHRATGGN